MGSRPDGGWRDRAGAASRLRDQLAALAARGLRELPSSVPAPALERWYLEFVLVVEGAARVIAAQPPPEPEDAPGGPHSGAGWPGGPRSRVRVVAAAGSGDDTIAALAGELPARRLVVTAD